MNLANLLKLIAPIVGISASTTFVLYFFILLKRTGYGDHQTSIGMDVVIATYSVAAIGLVVVTVCAVKRLIGRPLALTVIIITTVCLAGFISLNGVGKITDRSMGAAHRGSPHNSPVVL